MLYAVCPCCLRVHRAPARTGARCPECAASQAATLKPSSSGVMVSAPDDVAGMARAEREPA
jgi:hypothetical protein